MVLKTFNLDKEVYETYSKHCRKEGISMSKRVETFIKSELEKIHPVKNPATSTTPKETSSRKDDFHPMSKYC